MNGKFLFAGDSLNKAILTFSIDSATGDADSRRTSNAAWRAAVRCDNCQSALSRHKSRPRHEHGGRKSLVPLDLVWLLKVIVLGNLGEPAD